VSFPARYFPIIIILLILCGAGSSYAGWQFVHKFNLPISCGYFFDAGTGVVATGNFTSFSTIEIWWTNDGGNNWNQANIPDVITGRVTSFFMVDKLVGYASIYGFDYPPNNSVWQTTDGGKTWMDFTQGNFYRTACIYKTSKAFIKTLWDTQKIGGSSVDGGKTYSQIFSGGSGWSNGIDFADDNIGVVTLGPKGSSTTTSWCTQDGGVNWTKGGVLPESWSVYAVKGSRTFLTISEDDFPTPGQTVYWSQDGGFTWGPRCIFPNGSTFTGHIGGLGSTVYAQTDTIMNQGLVRSDDLGQTWKNIGGPSNMRDTRFCVTGCVGEVVYAFDNQGAVWKTTDGGDGTLMPGIGKADLTLGMDTLFISGTCGDIRGYINFRNLNCNSLSIDSVSISPDPYHEFSVDTNINNFELYPEYRC
jgi:hypothetical protein